MDVTDPVAASIEDSEHSPPVADVLGDDVTDRLVAVIKAAFPHRNFPDGPYRRTAEHIVSLVSDDAYQSMQLAQGLAGLDAVREVPFEQLTGDEALEVLRGIEHTAFFALVRSTTVTFMYSDREVWSVVGYEGESSHLGGYVDRGFDDLDWLPDPRIEESDEEFVSGEFRNGTLDAGGVPA